MGSTTQRGDARRDAIVEFVAEHHLEKGYGPTLREVAAAAGYRAHATAQYQVMILVAAGVLAVEPGIPRSIRLVAHSNGATGVGAAAPRANGSALSVGAEMHSREPQ